MEPISILTSVSAASRAALSLSTTLFSFVQATRNVDQYVRALYDEVTGLNRTLDAISSSLRTANIETPEQIQHDHDLWNSVVASLGDCRVALDSMRQTLQGVKQSGSNVAAQMLRVFKLNWKEDQIKTLRSQIQSHNTALHHLTSTAPRLVTDDLVPRFEMLTDMIMQLSQSQAPGSPQEDPQSHGTIFMPKEPPSFANLVVSAKDVLYQAKSTIAQSEGGSDNSSIITTVFHQLDLLDQDLQGNVAMYSGDQLDRPGMGLEHHRHVENWIPIGSSGINTSQSGSASATTRTQMTPSQSTFEMSTVGGERLFSDEDSDEGDELEYEILQGYLDRGFANYRKGDWATAEPYIRRAIDASKTLPLDKVRLKGIDLEEAQFKIAVCAFHQKKLDEADVELFQLRVTRPASNEPRNTTLRRILSVYLFAEICFERKRLEEAQKCSRKALTMKRKLLGETTWLETNCFSLLSAISAAQGDNLAAEVYKDKAQVPTTLDPLLEQEPEIRSARLDSLVDLRTKATCGGDQPPELQFFTDATQYSYHITQEIKHRPVVVYGYDLAWSQGPSHNDLVKKFAEYAVVFGKGKASFIHFSVAGSADGIFPQFLIFLKNDSTSNPTIWIKIGSMADRILAFQAALTAHLV